MDDFANALSALGVGGNAAPANTAPGYSTEPQMRAAVGGGMGADPQAALREINATQSQLASAKNLDPASRQMLLDHVTEMHRQLTGIPGAAAASQSPTQASVDSDFSNALDALSKPAQAAPAAPAPGAAPNNGAITTPFSELVANQASSLGSTVAGGYAGLYQGAKTLLQGGGTDKALNDAVNAIHETEQAGTYTPKTAEGAQMVKQFGSGYNPLNWIPNATQAVGNAGGDALASVGLPGAGAVVKGIGAAAPLALGLKSVQGGLSKLSDLVKPAGEALPEAARVDPTLDPLPTKPLYKLVDGKPVLISEAPPGAPSPIAPITPSEQPGATLAPINGIPRVEVRGTSADAAPPSIADATPAFQQAVADLEKKGTPLPAAVQAKYLEGDTLDVPVKQTQGEVTGDPVLLSNEKNGRGGAKPLVDPSFYNERGKAMGANLDVQRQAVAPDIPGDLHPAEAGQTLVDAYKNMDAPVKADISAKYKALSNANGGQLPLSGKDFMAAANQALEANNKGAFLPPEIQRTLAPYQDGGPMTYNNFENLRTILASAARKASAASDGNAAQAISTVRDSLESLPMTAETSAIKPLADAARNAARQRFQNIESDPAYKAAVNDAVPSGTPSPLADDFVRKFIINGKGSNVSNMAQNLAADSLAKQTMGAAGIDYLKKQAGWNPESGTFAAKSFSNGMGQLGPKMDSLFPARTSQQLGQLNKVATRAAMQPAGSFVNNSNTLTAAGLGAVKTGLEGLANIKTLGAYGAAKAGVGILRSNKAAKASVDPAAWGKLSDIGSK